MTVCKITINSIGGEVTSFQRTTVGSQYGTDTSVVTTSNGAGKNFTVNLTTHECAHAVAHDEIKVICEDVRPAILKNDGSNTFYYQGMDINYRGLMGFVSGAISVKATPYNGENRWWITYEASSWTSGG